MSNKKFNCAFYYALRDTLVTDTLDEVFFTVIIKAVAIGYKNGRAYRRVVTLDGQLVDNNGTLSGGGRSIKTGGMKSCEAYSEADISQIEADIKAIEEKYKQLMSEKSNLEVKLKMNQ